MAKLDGELVEIFEAVAYDTKLVPEDAILYNDYYFSDLEVPDLPFRCRSEYKAEPTSPIPEALDDAIQTCEQLVEGPRNEWTGERRRMNAFEWARFFAEAVVEVHCKVFYPELGSLRG